MSTLGRYALTDAATGVRHRNGKAYFDEDEMRRALFEPDDPDELMGLRFADPKSPLATDEDYCDELQIEDD